MKHLGIGFLVVVGILAFGWNAKTTSDPQLMSVKFSDGFIPDGFDTNDNVQIVAEGWFHNSCFRPGLTGVTVDSAKKLIHVDPTAYVYGGFCLQVMVNYTEVMNVGFLEAGKYKIVQGVEQAPLGEVAIRVAANSSPDDYFYAPINQAYVTVENGNASVKLSGVFTNSCMKLASVMTNVQTKVLVVQPIAELAEGSDCQQGEYPFVKDVVVEGVKPGRYLLHVRSLNSKAVNTLFDVY
ncbi:MAG: hypothetical protein ABL958_11540 [Bdellovibrionia bacterium]